MTQRAPSNALLLSGGLHAAAARSPTKIALICDDASLTYAELSSRIRRVCAGIQALGLRRGDRVALLAPNCLEYPELVVGLSDGGAIVATLNPRSTAFEVAAACNDCGAQWLFVHPSLAALAAAAPCTSITRTVVLDREYERWLAAAGESGPAPGLSESEPFTLVYSSGTTGKPKGILISHRSRTLTFHAMAMEYGCYGPDDRQLGIAPMAHGAGFAFIMATLYFGGTVEIIGKFDPALVIRKLAQQSFTGIFLVPTHFQAIFNLPPPVLERARGRARTLTTIISNAAALAQETKERVVDFWGEGKLHESYGSTEAGIVTNLRPRFQLTHPRSVGPAFALNSIRLLDETGSDVPRGEVGELHSRSPYLFDGYWAQSDETQAAHRDGWVSAGDLARQDPDGFFYIVDRKKDMVISGGLNVYPREIEEVLHGHPAVLETAVVGVPDSYLGETLRAFVVFRPGMHAEAYELDAHCRLTLSGYKVPKEFRFIEALPRNMGGKVIKRELRTTTP